MKSGNPHSTTIMLIYATSTLKETALKLCYVSQEKFKFSLLILTLWLPWLPCWLWQRVCSEASWSVQEFPIRSRYLIFYWTSIVSKLSKCQPGRGLGQVLLQIFKTIRICYHKTFLFTSYEKSTPTGKILSNCLWQKEICKWFTFNSHFLKSIWN